MERSSFFNAVLSGETYDRVYTAEDYARYFGSFIGNGVFPTPSTNLQVVADSTSMDIALKAGKGWINGYFYENTEDLTLNVGVADGVLNRIDRVVLRLDFINREIKAYVKKGTFASSPVAPNLTRNSDMYELGIADIKVNKGVTKIVQADITDLRQNNNYCGLVAGVLKQIDTTDLFAQFQSTFDIWFEHVKGQLSTDVAGNLQNQIDNMNIGVRNLVLNSKEKTITASSSQWNLIILCNNLEKDTEYTVSVSGSEILSGTFTQYTVLSQNATDGMDIGKINFNIGNNYQSFTFKTPNIDNKNYRVLVYAGIAGSTANNSLKIKEVKVEKGKYATGWIPSSDEIENAIDGKFGTLELKNRSANEDEIRTSKKNLNFCSTHTDGTEVGFLLDTLGGGTAAIRPYAGNGGKLDIGSTANRIRDIFMGAFNWSENGMTNINNQFVLKWGVITIDLPYGGSANKLINFPSPFNNECYAAFATADYDVAGDSRAATAGVIANAGVLKSSTTENKTQLWLTVGHTPVASTGWGSGTRPIRVRWFTIGH